MDERLSLEEAKFRRWRAAWTVTFSALAVGNLALVPAVRREDRIDFYVGAATSAAAIPLTLAFRQPEPAPFIDRDAAWRAVGDYQRGAHSWPMHAINLAFNAAVSAFLGFGYGRWPSAAANLVVGTAMGEYQIYTHPDGAVR